MVFLLPILEQKLKSQMADGRFVKETRSQDNLNISCLILAF